MLADQHLRGSVHGVRIQPDGHAPDPSAVQSEPGSAVQNTKEVAPLSRVKPGVPVIGHDLRVQNADGVVAEMMVERIADLVSADRFDEIDMGDLSQRMDTAIGPTRAVDL